MAPWGTGRVPRKPKLGRHSDLEKVWFGHWIIKNFTGSIRPGLSGVAGQETGNFHNTGGGAGE